MYATLKEQCLSVERCIYRNRFFGYEPYDGMNSRFEFLKGTKRGRMVLTHFNKMCPVNLRRVLGIRKYQHTKTLALLLSAYCNLYRLAKEEKYRLKYIECRDLLLAKELPDGGIGGSYDYQMRNWIYKKASISTLGTMLAVKGLIQGYSYFGHAEDLQKAQQLTRLILDRHVTRNSGRIHVTYAEGLSRPVLNMYAITAGTLSTVYAVTEERELIDLAKEIFEVVISEQFENGAWPFVAGDRYEATQIDFHQGFILEGLCEYLRAAPFNDAKVENALKHGCAFYWSALFSPKGRSYFRLNRKNPVDIQNQAEGIQALALCSRFVPEAIQLARAIADWTMRHMYDLKTGCFFYQRWPFFVNRIPYMAWGQAPMLLALSHLADQTTTLQDG